MDWPFGDLRPLSYSLIAADPPWDFKLYSAKGQGKSAQNHYACMSLDDIKALPVSQLAQKDCCLFLWATWPMLPQGMEVMKAWGFQFKTGGVWHKKTKHGKTAFGTGYRVRSASEPWLLGFTGNPKTSRAERNVIEGEVRGHSRKPEESFTWLERYIPDARRLELFSRQTRPGWDCFGDEAGKFDEVAA